MSEFSEVKKNKSVQGIIGNLMPSFSTAVNSYKQANWWTEEEARLYNSWAGAFEQYSNNITNPYFDYFFCGQDIKIKVDGLPDSDFLPIYSFGYMIQQEKHPYMGFSSYTYDAILRGTRLISGMFSIVATEPFLLTKSIARSASIRARTSQRGSTSAYALRNLDGDQEKIERYWRRNFDTALDAEDKHLFSIHPPFNFLISYGVQDVGLYTQSPASSHRAQEVKNDFKNNTPMWTDTNERLYSTTGNNYGIPNGAKVLLENIELTTKSIEYDTSGDPVLETYGFIARDERIVSSPDTMNSHPTKSKSTV